MAKVNWSASPIKKFDSGIDRVMLYVDGFPSSPWFGFVGITEDPAISGASRETYYNQNLYNISGDPMLKGQITAYTYPDSFQPCLGIFNDKGLFHYYQDPIEFNLAYRTQIRDQNSSVIGYNLNFVYNMLASPSTKVSATETDAVLASSFSWDYVARPVAYSAELKARPSASYSVSTTSISQKNVTSIENIIYGTTSLNPRMITPTELKTLTR